MLDFSFFDFQYQSKIEHFQIWYGANIINKLRQDNERFVAQDDTLPL